MAEERTQRRLAAILAADVVGYSRLMEADEVGTRARFNAHLKELIVPIIADNRGRIVKTMGDGLLMEFGSVVDAVRSAVAMQEGMTVRNSNVPDDQRIDFRIGVNLGEVIIEGEDIHGDGVNIAARLEGIADTGGVCVSGDVYRQCRGKVEVGFENLGSRYVKNIAEPVHAWRILPEGKWQAPTPKKPPTRQKTITAIVAALIVVTVAGGLAWWQPWAPALVPLVAQKSAFPLPDKPSIAVLPFTNMSEDRKQEYFADGITEDIITDLSKISGLFVIARNSVFVYKGKAVKIGQVAEQLGVRYVLEGSVRRAGSQVRVNAQLIDASTGGHLWAERYDGTLTDIFKLQDAVTGKVVQALELQLTKKDQERRSRQPRTDRLEAYDLVLQARTLLTRFDRKSAVKAREFLERAIKLDPKYAKAYSSLGLFHFDEWRLWGQNRNRNLDRALELSKTGIKLSPLDPAPHVLLAQVYQFLRDFDAANTEADIALKLEPRDAIALANLGSMLRYAHRAEDAVKVVGKAIRLDPFHPPNYLEWLGDSYFLVGRYDKCVQAAERGVALNPDFVALHVVSAKCYAALGRSRKAQNAAANVIRANPQFTLKAFASYVPFTDNRDLQRNVEMLRKAGLPE